MHTLHTLCTMYPPLLDIDGIRMLFHLRDVMATAYYITIYLWGLESPNLQEEEQVELHLQEVPGIPHVVVIA